MFYNSISRGLFSVFLRMVFGGLPALAMSSNVLICQICFFLRLVVPRAASRDQHVSSRAMKRYDSQLTLVLFSSNFGCGCACRFNTRRRVFVFRSFLSSVLLNA